MHDEIELKAVVPDPDSCPARVEAAGARLVFAGALVDRRWDRPERTLAARDEVVRVRVGTPAPGAPGTAHALLDWKGPTRRVDGYKVREERSTAVGDPALLEHVLAATGLEVSREVERTVAQYALDDATIRFEWYPRMDVLVEVEGTPAAIERAIVATGLPRARFGTGRLAEFAADFTRRTGTPAALCARELAGDVHFRDADG